MSHTLYYIQILNTQNFWSLKKGYYLKALQGKQSLHLCTQLLIWALGVLSDRANLRHELNNFLWFLKQYENIILKDIRNKRHGNAISCVWAMFHTFEGVKTSRTLFFSSWVFLTFDEPIFSPSRIIHHIICLISKGFSPKYWN